MAGRRTGGNAPLDHQVLDIPGFMAAVASVAASMNVPEYAAKNSAVLKNLATGKWFRILVSEVDNILRAPKAIGPEVWEKMGVKLVPGFGKTHTEKECLATRGVTIGKLLGQGAYGRTYQGKLKGTAVAVKVESIAQWRTTQKNVDEIREGLKACLLAGKHGVGPRVIDYFLCDTAGDPTGEPALVTVMDLVKGVVWQEFSQTASMDALRKAQALLERKVELMHKYNIVHNDLHPGNVLVVGKTKGAVQDVVIIDFGKSVEIDQKYVFHNDDEKVKAMVMERNMRFTAECISAELVRLGAVRI